MTGTTSFDERIRAELDRMRTEVRAERPAPAALLARARRAMAVTLASAVLVTSAVVGGSIVAWRSLTPGGSERVGIPADEGPATPSPSIPSGSAEELRARPLALPVVPAGAACPTTPTVRIEPGPRTGFTGPASVQQAGDVYLAMSGHTVALRTQDLTPDGWYSVKDVWVVAGSYSGPVLVRGGRIDAEGPLQLAWNPTTEQVRSLVIDEASPSLQRDFETGWRSVPMEAFVRTPGCYAYQVDGVGFTAFIVFEASV